MEMGTNAIVVTGHPLHARAELHEQTLSQEKRMRRAMDRVRSVVLAEEGLTLMRQRDMSLSYIHERLNGKYGDLVRRKYGYGFQQASDGAARSMRPDGGFWYVKEWGKPRRWVIVSEAKRQGTNDAREQEGSNRQAKGNAIERVAKNMIGVESLFVSERINPFVCFGEGCDFEPGSYVLDRVSTMNRFFPLNKVYVEKFYGPDGAIITPASMFFRKRPWTTNEMEAVFLEVVRRSIAYYQKRYGLPAKGQAASRGGPSGPAAAPT